MNFLLQQMSAILLAKIVKNPPYMVFIPVETQILAH